MGIRAGRAGCRWTLLLVAMGGGCLAAPEVEPGGGEASPRREVASLGLAPENPLEQIRGLHVVGSSVLPALVGELRVIRPGTPDANEMHIIWCIRALRSLTGQEFQHVTAGTDPCELQEFLGRDGPLPFFAEWMSRGRVYVAPRDVQAAVIADWRAWVRAHPACRIRDYAFWPDGWYF